MATHKRFQRKLRALDFPIWNKFDIEKMDDIKTLVVYLEQTKIRELKVSERAGLKDTKNKNWNRAFGKYLNDMEDCPYQMKQKMNPKDWVEIIEWLVSQAVARSYSDNRDEFNRRTPIRRVERREYALSGCSSGDTIKAMNDLCKYLNIPPNSSHLVTAQTLCQFIKTKFSASSIANYEATVDDEDEDDSKRDKNMLRKRFAHQHDPWKRIFTADDIIKYYGNQGQMGNHLGFTTGNEMVDAAAIILRVLYVLDVRQSQNQLNEIVTYLQRFTANPKTNANLGKVGR